MSFASFLRPLLLLYLLAPHLVPVLVGILAVARSWCVGVCLVVGWWRWYPQVTRCLSQLIQVLYVAGLTVPYLLARLRGGTLPLPPLSPKITRTSRIGIFVTSYNEEATIERCLRSVRQNMEGSSFSNIRLVLLDSNSTDSTVRLATPLVDRVVECPRGKLNAKHHGFGPEGVETNVDVVVCVDGDRYYGTGWLDSLLTPYLVDGVVATCGRTYYDEARTVSHWILERAFCLPFDGGNCTFLRQAYLASPFDLTVDQFKNMAIWCEEEFRFGLWLQRFGRVHYEGGTDVVELRTIPLRTLLPRWIFNRAVRSF